MISAYQCGLGASPSTVLSQQRRFFDSINDNRHPREIFITDSYNELENWIKSGNKIILMIDANDYVLSGDLAKALELLEIYEAITNKHHN